MCSSNYILMIVLSSWIHSLIILHAFLSVCVSYRIDCLFKLNDEIYLLIGFIFIMIISTRILKFVVFVCSFVVVCNAFCPPHDFSERLKIWNFGKNKKVLSWWVDVQQQRKFLKKLFFSASCDFFSANDQWPISVKSLLHRGLLLAQC